MAITASVALGSATSVAQQSVAVTLTVNNSGGTPVNVTGVVPLFYPTGYQTDGPSGAIGVCALGPGITVAIPASGALTFNWNVIAFKPQGGFGVGAELGTSKVYVCGATVYTSDGSVTTATTANLTVSNFP